MTWQLLAEANSHNTEAHGNAMCNCRWFEVSISRRFEDDVALGRPEYKVVMTGKSTIQYETDRIRTETTTSPHAVVDFLAMGERGKRYVPKVSRKALHEAGDIDKGLAEALDDFDSLVA